MFSRKINQPLSLRGKNFTFASVTFYFSQLEYESGYLIPKIVLFYIEKTKPSVYKRLDYTTLLCHTAFPYVHWSLDRTSE